MKISQLISIRVVNDRAVYFAISRLVPTFSSSIVPSFSAKRFIKNVSAKFSHASQHEAEVRLSIIEELHRVNDHVDKENKVRERFRYVRYKI